MQRRIAKAPVVVEPAPVAVIEVKAEPEAAPAPVEEPTVTFAETALEREFDEGEAVEDTGDVAAAEQEEVATPAEGEAQEAQEGDDASQAANAPDEAEAQ